MKKKKKKSRAGSTLVIIIALAVMIFAVYKLLTIYMDYRGSEKTYRSLEEQYVDTGDDEERRRETDSGLTTSRYPLRL